MGDQRDVDPDLVHVGAEALGARLLELGPLPRDPHMDLLRGLARSVLEAAADEVHEAAMVPGGVRSEPGWVDGAWSPADEAAARVEHGGRHPNEQPGRRMSPGQQSLVAAALTDLAGWCDSHLLAIDDGGREAAGVVPVLEEIRRRAGQGHVGVAVSRWLREHDQDDAGPSLRETDPKLIGALVELAQEYGLRGIARVAALMLAAGDEVLAPAEPEHVVNRRPNQVADLDAGFAASKPPGIAAADAQQGDVRP